MDLMYSQQLNEALRPQVAACPTVPQYHNRSVPTWDGREEEKQSEKEEEQQRKRASLLQIQQSYLRGFLDPSGRRWCWMCFQRAKMLFVGSLLGYPAIPRSFLSCPDWPPEWWPGEPERPCEGEEIWFAIARNCSIVIVEGVIRYYIAKDAYKRAIQRLKEQRHASKA